MIQPTFINNRFGPGDANPVFFAGRYHCVYKMAPAFRYWRIRAS